MIDPAILLASRHRRGSASSVAGGLHHWTVTPATTTPTAGDTVVVSAQAKDANGANVTGVRTALWSATGSGSLATASTSTDASGLATNTLTTSGSAGDVETVTVSDGAGHTGTSSAITTQSTGAFDGPAELPRVYIDTTYPTINGITYHAHSGDTLQTIINTAAAAGTDANDIILLDAGASFPEILTLPNKTGNGYIVLRTNVDDTACPPGTRMTPTKVASMNLAKIVAPNYLRPPGIIGNGCVETLPGSHHWRFSLIELTVGGIVGQSFNYPLVFFGDATAASVAALPHHHILDRVYVHASVADQHYAQAGVVFDAPYSACVDSWIDDLAWYETEVTGISGGAAPGPFKIVNNHVAAETECVLFGGKPALFDGMGPCDLEIRKNHLYKPLSWFGNANVVPVKNILEFKNGRRALIEDNILENCWQNSDQPGEAMAFMSGGDSGTPGTVFTGDITVRWNHIINCLTGITPNANYSGQIDGGRYSIHDNLMELNNIDPAADSMSGFTFGNALFGMSVHHNTLIRAAGFGFGCFVIAGSDGAYDIDIHSNIMGSGRPYCVIGDYGGSNTWLATWANGPGTNYLDHNVFYDAASAIADPPNFAFPGNNYPVTKADVGFDTDYSLLNTSPYKGTGRGGTDPGCNVASLTTRLAGVAVAP